MNWFERVWFSLIDSTLLNDSPEKKSFRARKLKNKFRYCGENLKICKGAHFSAPNNIQIGHNVYIGIFNYIGVGDIQIKDNVLLGPYVSITANEHLFSRDHMDFQHGNDMRPIILERNCFIASHAVVTAGVTVGKGALVAAGAVVTHDVPDHTIVAGIPARPIGKVDNPLIFSSTKLERDT